MRNPVRKVVHHRKRSDENRMKRNQRMTVIIIIRRRITNENHHPMRSIIQNENPVDLQHQEYAVKFYSISSISIRSSLERQTIFFEKIVSISRRLSSSSS